MNNGLNEIYILCRHSWWTKWHWSRYYSKFFGRLSSFPYFSILIYHRTHEVRDSPDQAAHYHTLNPKLEAPYLIRHLAGLGVKVNSLSFYKTATLENIYFSFVWSSGYIGLTKFSRPSIQYNKTPRHRHPRIAPTKSSKQKFSVWFQRDTLGKAPPRWPPSANICGNTNVPLSIIIKSDTAPCQFVNTGYTKKNVLEYSVWKYCAPTILR
jgi:hypothetical protein